MAKKNEALNTGLKENKSKKKEKAYFQKRNFFLWEQRARTASLFLSGSTAQMAAGTPPERLPANKSVTDGVALSVMEKKDSVLEGMAKAGLALARRHNLDLGAHRLVLHAQSLAMQCSELKTANADAWALFYATTGELYANFALCVPCLRDLRPLLTRLSECAKSVQATSAVKAKEIAAQTKAKETAAKTKAKETAAETKAKETAVKTKAKETAAKTKAQQTAAKTTTDTLTKTKLAKRRDEPSLSTTSDHASTPAPTPVLIDGWKFCLHIFGLYWRALFLWQTEGSESTTNAAIARDCVTLLDEAICLSEIHSKVANEYLLALSFECHTQMKWNEFAEVFCSRIDTGLLLEQLDVEHFICLCQRRRAQIRFEVLTLLRVQSMQAAATASTAATALRADPNLKAATRLHKRGSGKVSSRRGDEQTHKSHKRRDKGGRRKTSSIAGKAEQEEEEKTELALCLSDLKGLALRKQTLRTARLSSINYGLVLMFAARDTFGPELEQFGIDTFAHASDENGLSRGSATEEAMKQFRECLKCEEEEAKHDSFLPCLTAYHARVLLADLLLGTGLSITKTQFKEMSRLIHEADAILKHPLQVWPISAGRFHKTWLHFENSLPVALLSASSTSPLLPSASITTPPLTTTPPTTTPPTTTPPATACTTTACTTTACTTTASAITALP